MPQKTQKQVQIDWIVNQLQEGKERQEILEEFGKKWKHKSSTFDERLKKARERHKSILAKRKKENDKTLAKDPEWQETRSKLLESKKLIYESLSYIILKKRKKVNIKGEERTVLDLDLENSKDLRTIWEMMSVGLGEPTTVSSNKHDHTTKGESLNKSRDLSQLSEKELKQLEEISKKVENQNDD